MAKSKEANFSWKGIVLIVLVLIDSYVLMRECWASSCTSIDNLWYLGFIFTIIYWIKREDSRFKAVFIIALAFLLLPLVRHLIF